MNENLYASPQPVEEFALDEKSRQNAKSLRVTAWGMMVTATGFLMMALLFFMEVLEYFTGLMVAGFWERFAWPVGSAALFALFIGPVLCLACGNYLVRHGRWMVLGFLLFFHVPWVAGSMMPFGGELLSLAFVAAVYVAHILWGVFLLRMIRALSVGHYRVLVWMGLVLGTVTLLLISADMTRWRIWTRLLEEHLPMSINYTCFLMYLAGTAMCGYVTLLLGFTLFRHLRMSQNTENHHE